MSPISLRRPRVRFVFALAFIVLIAILAPSLASAEPVSPAAEVGKYKMVLPAIQVAQTRPTTGASYQLIPVEPPPTDRPAPNHGDLNLGLRGYEPTQAPKALINYGGNTDWAAPQVPGVFSDNRTPEFTSVHQVYNWDWACSADGCRGELIDAYPVTLLGMKTERGELLSLPSCPREIYGGDYVVLVLYAEEHRITLKYTREDNVVDGYTVHLENLDVDANLLDLYREADQAGRGRLPALRNGQPLGLANGEEVLIAIRDKGNFMDPRSRKDWWQGR